jgi:hypothetical protein
MSDESTSVGEAKVIKLSPKESKESKDSEKRGPGRPTNAEKLKDVLRERSKERQDFVDNHPLVQANPLPAEVNSAVGRLILVKYQMSREAAALEFNKFHLDLEGKETATVSSRIVGILDKMSNIDLEIKKLGNVVVDPRSDEVQKMVAVWIRTLTETLSDMVKDSALEPQTMDLLINKFSNALEGWEDRVDGGD